MTAAERAGAAAAMTALFLGAVGAGAARTVAGYWPVRGEIDVLPLLDRLRGRGHEIALPCVGAKDAPLTFRLWDGDRSSCVSGAFDIPEPAASAAVVVPDIMLVPLAAFDARGHRLGYGAGFYDRTLHALRRQGKVLAVGVAYALQGVDFLPAEETDIPMDIIVTDAAVYRFDAGNEKKEQG